MIESQAAYILRCIDKLLVHDLRTLEPNAEVAAQQDASLQDALARTVWGGKCGSWYKNASGRITNNWPHSVLRYRWRMRRPDFAEYDMGA